jgi:hypothetical protein
MSPYVESDRLLEKGNGSGRREVWMTYLKELLNLMDEVHRLLRPRKDNLQGMSKNVNHLAQAQKLSWTTLL